MASASDKDIVPYSFEYQVGSPKEKSPTEKIIIKITHGSIAEKTKQQKPHNTQPQASQLDLLKRFIADKYRGVPIEWQLMKLPNESENTFKAIVGDILAWDDKVNGPFTFNFGLGSVCEAINKILEVNDALKNPDASISGENTWSLLEFSSDVAAYLLRELGVMQALRFEEVYDLSDDAIKSYAQPALAIIMQFPITDIFDVETAKEKERLADQHLAPDVYFIKQNIENASATIAILHSLINAGNRVDVGGGSLKSFFDESKNLASEKRYDLLEKYQPIKQGHENAAKKGQTEILPVGLRSFVGYATFVSVGGMIYELNSKKANPVPHGASTDQSFLYDVTKICKRFIEREPKNLNFSIMALFTGEV